MKQGPLLSNFTFQIKWYNIYAVCFLLVMMLLAGKGNAQKTTTYSTAGTYTFVPPCDVTSITVQAWGAGGGGGYARTANGAAGGGGGGGAYASSVVAVTPGVAYTITVGAGGAGAVNNGSPSENGNNSTFNTTILVAAGGFAGASSTTISAAAPGGGGTVAASTGTTRFAGGQGATGIAGTAVNAGGGGGGGSAGTAVAGNFTVPTVSVNGAAAVAGGGAGGNGLRDADGNPGNAPGAGGAGAHRATGNNVGGDGADGRVVITYTSVFTNYCQSVPLNQGLNDGISQVIFNTINNSTTTNAGTEYTDFGCTLNTNVERGLTYLLSVYINTGGNNTRTQRAWIDWNQDGDFADAGETFNLASLTNVVNGLNTINIAIPVTATLGPTKMRITSSSSANPNSCDNQNFSGQVEDYRITVLAPVSCTGTPTPGTITISAASGAPNSVFTLTASGYSIGTGITYQWQSAPAAIGPWANIGGATNVPTQNITASASPGNTTFYRLLVTCTASALSAGSNSVNFVTSSATTNIPTNGSTINIACGTNTTLYDNGGAAGELCK